MLELDHIHFAWPDGRKLLNDLSICIAPGEKVVLLGANGCGKSSLLQLINGLLTPDQGEIRYQGQPVSPAHLGDRARARDFRRACVLLFQHPEAMLFNPTLRDELAYGLRHLDATTRDARIAHWSTALHLADRLDAAPWTLSGGEKQKLLLACLLAMAPTLLLLDEPAASLDPATVGWLIDTLMDSPATVLISTHNLSMAAELGSRALILGSDGRWLYDGPVHAALADLPLLETAGLAHRHRHRHRHSPHQHSHPHLHNWA